MYRSLDLRRWVQIADGYREYRHLHPLHEAVKAPMLLGYPNLFAVTTLRWANDGLQGMLADADIVLAREPWQMPFVLDHVDEGTPVVFSSHNVETERFGDIHQPAFVNQVERRVDALERRAVEETDAIVCTSERDAEVYRQSYDVDSPVIVVPNGTYEDALRAHRPDSSTAQALRQEYEIDPDDIVCLFMGSNYRPNVEAANAIVDVFADLGSNDESLHLLVVGGVGKALRRRSLPANVTVTGYLEDDFEAHLDLADIALNPMRSGGGTNIKLIDYFARSLPVISTPFGARGLDSIDGEVLVQAEIPDFPQAIRSLALNPSRRQELGESGHELAAKRYTWEAGSRYLRDELVELFGPF